MPVHSSLRILPALSNSEVRVQLAFPSPGKNALTLTGLPFVSLVFRTLNLTLKHTLDSKVENACSLPEHCTASAKTEKTSFHIVLVLAKGSQEPHRGPAGFWISV